MITHQYERSGLAVPKLAVKTSVIPYKADPDLGERTINALGVIKPLRGTPDIREFESRMRLEAARSLHQPLRRVLQGQGLEVTEVGVTGSAASGFAYSGSDLDLLFSLKDEIHTRLSADYHLRDLELDIMINEALMDEFLKYPFAVDVHLNNTFQHPEYLKRLAVLNSLR